MLARRIEMESEVSRCAVLSGGSSPFQLLIMPIFGSQRVFEMPSSAFNNGKGSFKTQLALPKGQQFLITMFSNSVVGDISQLLTVGAPTGASCNTTDPGVEFNYQLDSALQQCRTFLFDGYSSAVQPVKIIAMIPGGNATTLSPQKGLAQFEWTANVKSGTSMVFVMSDANGRLGGVSDVRVVGATNDATCLNSDSPSSTAQPVPSATSPAEAANTSPSTTTFSGTTIAAVVAGGLVGTIAICSVVIFFVFRRRRRFRDDNKGQFMEFQEHHDGSAPMNGGRLEPDPFVAALPRPTSTNYSPGAPSSSTNLISPLPSLTMGSPYSTVPPVPTSKAAMIRAANERNRPSRYLIHTDAADDIIPDESDIIELPPQYSESRRPILGLTIPDIPGSSSNIPHPHPPPP
ncbi:hypothetical protein HETIRDRAFT_431760 [Heterobasidion irregulare TC 32-1]|uniref:Uncharacterized protein n=1 Tax=Heterobasidion irregulare (strain TC 32-1) TaxID=747525 RepID=W4KPV0_HETIT|nr:uncharacterized protein HETIRDRAFT_431760 [Heterobasidion irregulare TC 32-1]ETW87415.1 hypothetical protein HETIRDRAFT_431760 [Heterobasidion irregulare TC 32-1]